jgi:hypothetical protein
MRSGSAGSVKSCDASWDQTLKVGSEFADTFSPSIADIDLGSFVRSPQVSLAKLQTSPEQLKVPRSFLSETASTIAGARKVYKSGRVAMAHAKSRTDEALHEWRKQTKYLLSALDLLQSVFAVAFKKKAPLREQTCRDPGRGS